MGQLDDKVLSSEIRGSQLKNKLKVRIRFLLLLHFFSDLFSYLATRFVQFFRVTSAAFELINILFIKFKSFLVVRLFWGRGNFYKNFFRIGLVIVLFSWVYSTLSGNVTSSSAADYADTLYVMQKKDYEVELGSMSPPIDENRPRDSVQEYVVQGGDTISGIAEKFDISVDTIKWSNGLTSDYIRPGQGLKILPVTGVLHKVKGGDTLSNIADKYKASEQAIADVNWIDPPFILQEGVELMIPGGSIQAPVSIPQTVITTVSQTDPQSTTPAVSGTGQFIMPTNGYISQYYWRWHRAIDIASKGVPDVVAADSGRVFYSGWDSSGYGLTILIDHGNGFVTRYAHASSLYVRSGEYVTRGQPIMRMGSTGRSTGVHLHFEVILNGVYQNPLSYL